MSDDFSALPVGEPTRHEPTRKPCPPRRPPRPPYCEPDYGYFQGPVVVMTERPSSIVESDLLGTAVSWTEKRWTPTFWAPWTTETVNNHGVIRGLVDTKDGSAAIIEVESGRLVTILLSSDLYLDD